MRRRWTSAPRRCRSATSSTASRSGIGHCGSVASASCKVTLIATDDGGASRRVLGVPAGLRSMLNPDDPSCATNGGVLGPCVDRVLFADDRNGYLFGLHEFYWTTDGGENWHHAPQPTEDSSGVPTVNNVPTMAVADGYAYRMFASHESSSGGSGRLQRAPIGTNNWTDISPADAGIYTSFLARERACAVSGGRHLRRPRERAALPVDRPRRSLAGGRPEEPLAGQLAEQPARRTGRCGCTEHDPLHHVRRRGRDLVQRARPARPLPPYRRLRRGHRIGYGADRGRPPGTRR